MMDLRPAAPKAPVVKPGKPLAPTIEPVVSQPTTPTSNTKPLDIFAGIQTAPELSSHTKPKVTPATIDASVKPVEAVVPIKPAEVAVPEIVEPLPDIESEPEPAQVAARPETLPEPLAPAQPVRPINLDDQAVDKAVDDIIHQDADDVLAAQDMLTHYSGESPVTKADQPVSILTMVLSLVGVVIVAALILLAVPSTRYRVSGVFIKEPVTIQLLDAKTKLPLIGASIMVGTTSVQTNALGKVTLNLPVGTNQLDVVKAQYQPVQRSIVVDFKPPPILTIAVTPKQ